MRILIACDKFKGTLTAAEANQAIAAALPGHELHLQPIADGGEGTAAVLGQGLNGKRHVAAVTGPLGNPVTAPYWVSRATAVTAQQLAVPKGSTVAFMDMSAASGLQLMAASQRDPWLASTYGTGQLLLAGLQAGATHTVMGLGGSATNDGGAGLARALDYRFVDACGHRVDDIPNALQRCARIEPPSRPLPDITVACDVKNPLLGAQGAIAVYGAQKGVSAQAQDKFERRLAHLASITASSLGVDHTQTPGAGAAGGLGFGLLSFTNAELRPGFALLAELLQLERIVTNVDLVITGEGSLDAQSLHGKGPTSLAQLASSHQVPTLALCGQTDNSPELHRVFAKVLALVTKNAPIPEDSAQALTQLVQRHRQEIMALAKPGHGWRPTVS